ncbi:hypothetical protein [Xenorhabdus budapestensis]|nr:hypothetical protein [Xenorhabdus budapestensis]
MKEPDLFVILSGLRSETIPQVGFYFQDGQRNGCHLEDQGDNGMK